MTVGTLCRMTVTRTPQRGGPGTAIGIDLGIKALITGTDAGATDGGTSGATTSGKGKTTTTKKGSTGTTAKPTTTTTAKPLPVAQEGASCSSNGAKAVTKRGTSLTCGPAFCGGTRLRWSSRPCQSPITTPPTDPNQTIPTSTTLPGGGTTGGTTGGP